MGVKMNRRERIYNKYNGLCAYSGTPLEPDWQIDHVEPVIRSIYTGKPLIKELDCESNMVPCQRVINNYKFTNSLEVFRTSLLGGLHIRLKRYPRSGKGGELRKRMEKIAGYFGITPDSPFSGEFYFEKINNTQAVSHE
jgi:hypothetical protein